MTSAKRHDLKVAIERRNKKDLVAEVASLVGTPTACPIATIRRSGRGDRLPGSRASGARDANASLMR